MKPPNPKNVDISSDAERLYQVSCTDCQSMIADSDRLLQETVGNTSAGLPETITISSALELVPPVDDGELPKGSHAIDRDQMASSSPFSTPSTSVPFSTGWPSSPVSTVSKESKKDKKRGKI